MADRGQFLSLSLCLFLFCLYPCFLTDVVKLLGLRIGTYTASIYRTYSGNTIFTFDYYSTILISCIGRKIGKWRRDKLPFWGRRSYFPSQNSLVDLGEGRYLTSHAS